MAKDGLGRRVIERHNKLAAARANWDTLWQDIADYVMPRKSHITDYKTPDVADHTQDLYDMTATHANLTLGAGQYDYLVSGRWFDLSAPEELDDPDQTAREWYKRCAEIMLREINRSNFQMQIHEAFLDRGGFGTCHIHCDEGDEGELLNFRSYKVGTFSIAENHKGYVDTVSREFSMTARQLVQKFGIDKVGAEVAKAYQGRDGKDMDKPFIVVHQIKPREDHERDSGKKDPQNKPVASVYVLKKGEHVLRDSGYDELPFACSRFLKWGDASVYGYCPSIEVLPTVKQLNFIERQMDALAEKAAFPPMLWPDSLSGDIDAGAGGVTIFDPNTPNAKPEEWQTKGRYDIGLNRVEQKREFIREAYHVDLFKVLAQRKKDMTATEVLELVEEKLVNFSPTFSRLTSEFFTPMLRRVFGICLRAGKFPDVPVSVMQQTRAGPSIPEPEPVFISKIALAMKALQNKSFLQFQEMVAGLVEINPEVMDNMDTDGAFRKIGDNQGVASDFFRTLDEVEEIRKQRQEEQERQRAMEEAAQGAKAAGDMGRAPPELQRQVMRGAPN